MVLRNVILAREDDDSDMINEYMMVCKKMASN